MLQVYCVDIMSSVHFILIGKKKNPFVIRRLGLSQWLMGNSFEG
uniref:Uncharacterized protein n=1 Tax=Rhizophora mucronata TaxID=61149 RepID=A0A2P2ILV2_RHIMU